MRPYYDAVVVGAGPNGLAAAIVLARSGLSVLVVERAAEPGGGARTSELTLAGYLHDVCSSVHPFALASPFFARLPLAEHGLTMVQPPAALAHVLDHERVVMLERSVDETAQQLGDDAEAYRALFEPLVSRFRELCEMALGPLRLPDHPGLYLRFGLEALRPLSALAESELRDPRSLALLAGIAGHAMRPLDEPMTTSFALLLGAAGHAVGWPVVRGGSRALTQALVSHLQSLGADLECGREVRTLRDLPRARAVLFDVTPRQLLELTGSELPALYRHRLRGFQYGSGVFKVDWALSAPIPWAQPACARAATVHLSGTLRAISDGEASVLDGRIPEHPLTLVVQPTLFDPTRAPEGRHTAWAYCHVPHGSTLDLTALLEAEIERFAPGFRDVILARSALTSADFERYNPNYVGGDINGGSARWTQLLTRPIASVDPYATGDRRFYLCSSSTPPGGGVHGMCGYFAARSALRRAFGKGVPHELELTAT
jgi:phytoene dehydrogenase-like protein